LNEIYYDYVDYWKKEGERSKVDSLSFRLTREHEVQEKPIIDAVKLINPKSILEIGAGWGRIAKLLRGAGVDAQYTAMDLSYLRLQQITDKTIGRIVTDFYTYAEDIHYDTILAIETLMHIPPDIIEDFVAKMKRYADTIIIIDYDPQEHRDIELADHNFQHDYDKLFPNSTVDQINYVQKLRVWQK